MSHAELRSGGEGTYLRFSASPREIKRTYEKGQKHAVREIRQYRDGCFAHLLRLSRFMIG